MSIADVVPKDQHVELLKAHWSLQDTNRRLNRRCQVAESWMATKNRLMSAAIQEAEYFRRNSANWRSQAKALKQKNVDLLAQIEDLKEQLENLRPW